MDGSSLSGHRVNVLQMSSFLSCDEWPADRKPVKEVALKFVSNLTNYCDSGPNRGFKHAVLLKNNFYKFQMV